MKEKIEDVQAYFKAKLLAGEFTVKEIKTHIATVMVDDYPFVFWVSNMEEYPNTCITDANSCCYGSFIHLEWTNTEALSMAVQLSKAHSDAVKAEKLLQLENLKKELGL